MKQWSKIERDIQHSLYVRELIAEHGLKGFGAYMIMRNIVECYDDVTVVTLKAQCLGMVRLNMFNSLLNNNSLFYIDAKGYIRSALSRACAGAPAQAPVPTDAPSDTQAPVPEDVPAAVPYSEKEREREEKKNKSCSSINHHHNNQPFSKPSFDDVSQYCEECQYSFNIRKFFTYYESKGWKVGRYITDDWKALVDNWAIRELEKTVKDNNYDETTYINDIY